MSGTLTRIPVIEAAAPERRAFTYALGIADIAFVVIDVASVWPHPGVVLAGRGALASVLLGTAAALGRVRDARAARLLVMASAVAAAACLDVIAWGAGGAQGPYLPLLAIAPIVLFIAAPDVPWAIALCGVVSAVPGLAMRASAGTPGASLALWSAAFLSATGYGIVGAVLHLRVRGREERALADLADSEARRARAERLALAGRLAAGVARGVRAPLAAVLAGVRRAEDALALESAKAGAREALRDARLALERIVRVTADVASLTRDAPEERAVLELEPLLEEAQRLAELRGVTVEALDLARGLPRVHGPRQALSRVLAGVLVITAEAGRGEADPPARIAVVARRDGTRLVVAVEPLAGGVTRADRRALDDDPLVVLAREQLDAAGGTLEIFDGACGPGMRLALPIGEDHAPPRLTRS